MPIHFLRPNFNANTFYLNFGTKNFKEFFLKENASTKTMILLMLFASHERSEVKNIICFQISNKKFKGIS